jgi:hypothetical protein
VFQRVAGLSPGEYRRAAETIQISTIKDESFGKMSRLGARLEGVGERPQQPRNNKSHPFTGRPNTEMGG